MAHILKDVLMGSTIVVVGMVLSLVAALVLLILWILFHVLGVAFLRLLLHFSFLLWTVAHRFSLQKSEREQQKIRAW